MKLCINCVYYSELENAFGQKLCLNTLLTNLVTGNQIFDSCHDQRYLKYSDFTPDGTCGPDAKYYRPTPNPDGNPF